MDQQGRRPLIPPPTESIPDIIIRLVSKVWYLFSYLKLFFILILENTQPVRAI